MEILNTIRRIDDWFTPLRMAVIILAALILAGGWWVKRQNINLTDPPPVEVEDNGRLKNIA
jgi:hypothetical protein